MSMEFARLGRTALQVSRLCLGTMNFGPETSEADSHKIMEAALEQGLNFIDTANVYGRNAGRGATEEIIGRWFAKGEGRRDRVVLATKVYGQMSERVNDRGLSALNIRRACEASLKRLQTDRIDLYQMHHVDRTAPWEEVWEAMERLTREGMVIYVGSSNFAGWHISRANEAAGQRRFLGLVSEQCLYNLAARTVELEVLPACREYGLGVIPWSPLHGGLLGGAAAKAKEGRRASKMVQEDLVNHGDALEAFESLCASLGERPADVALAWLLGRPGITAPIIGPRTIAQFTGALRALEIKLDQATLQRLDEIWPGPGGEAPEAFAW